jgi:hypothetical protein
MNNANFTVTGQGGIFLLVLYDTEADNNDTIAMQAGVNWPTFTMPSHITGQLDTVSHGR